MKEENINYWAKKVSEIDPKLGQKLNDDRNTGYENLDKLDLPRYKRKKMELTDFLANPELAVSNLDSEKFFISLIPKDKNHKRCGDYNLDISQVKNYIKENITPANQAQYQIVINQFFKNLYGGNIVVGKDGEIYAEFKKGEHQDIQRGKIRPEFIVTKNNFTGSIHYNFTDESLRKIFYQTLLTIPHQSQGREQKFPPGYYEFVIIKRNNHSNPEPIFLDYKDNPTFNL